MAKRDREEEKEGLEALLLGDKPKLKDLADPKKRKQAMRVAKMMGIDVRREQLTRIAIGLAIVLVILLVGLWAIAKVLGLLFWALVVVGACVVAGKLLRPREKAEEQIEPKMPRQLEVDRKRVEADEREADSRADKALEELEKRLRG